MKNNRKTLAAAVTALALTLSLAACSLGTNSIGKTDSGESIAAVTVSGSGNTENTGNTADILAQATGTAASETQATATETAAPEAQTEATETQATATETAAPEAQTEATETQATATETAASEAQTEAPEASTSGTTTTDGSYTYDPVYNEAGVTSGGVLDAGDFFTKRDLRQNADLSEAVYFTVSDGQNIMITEAGVYVISGSAKNVTVTVEAGDDDKVQLVLDGLNLTNTSAPCIYVKNADKVFITTAADTLNTLTVTGSFTADGDTNTDAVIYSKDDLVLNGLGTLTVKSTDNGISCKDDLKITGGTLNINCTSDALEANDSILISGGSITIVSKKDGLHAEYDEDSTLGFIYICGGTLNITAGDDGIHATTYVQIDGGEVTINAAEGIEGTYVQINGGTVNITASDDGINGARKSGICTPTVEVNGGTLTIKMGAGDTDGIDSNGNLYINGGSINITAQSPFDYDGTGKYTGGTLIVNGTQTTVLQNQQMGGGTSFGGDQGGNRGGRGGRW